MPARATIITGQHVASHGVWMNGVSLPPETPTIAHWLRDHGYRTALVGKAHFEPGSATRPSFYENRMARARRARPSPGFRAHGAGQPLHHRPRPLRRLAASSITRRSSAASIPMVTPQGQQNTAGGGDTGAIQVWPRRSPRDLYHTDWVAERTMAWLDGLDADEDWFVWMSFPDPHHPWDPPAVRAPPRGLARGTAAGRLPGQPAREGGRAAEDEAAALARLVRRSLWSNLESPPRLPPMRPDGRTRSARSTR